MATGKRPVTQALNLARYIRGRCLRSDIYLASADRLVALLVEIDASTGKPDAARKHRAKKRPAKKARR